MVQFQQIQQALSAEQVDGWLFYDFRKSNPLAYQVLDLPVDEMYTRRWFYFIPTQGTPVALVSAVESHTLHALPGEQRIFRTWQEMQGHLQSLLHKCARVAMEYSPLNAIPYISRVDAGTVELIRSLGVDVVSSANLAQRFISQLSEAQIVSHREAGRRLIVMKNRIFAELGAALSAGREVNEYQVQQRFLDMMREAGLEPPEGEYPIVAVNSHSGNPHYEPGPLHASPIRQGDLILFDFWGRLSSRSDSVYADYTWLAFAGTHEDIPARQREVFDIVRNAREAAITFIRDRLTADEQVEGWQVDDAARQVINQAGYGDFFVHRTGHSIGIHLHGNGANMDNFETQDRRLLLPRTCNSIEPGIYLPEFGIRSEVNLLIHEHTVEVTGIPAQQAITPLL